MSFRKQLFGFGFTLLPFLGWVSLRPAFAQPITAATDGTDTVVTQDGNQINITGGSFSGDAANLFHSFEQFGLDQGQIATFLTDPNTQNVLGRIVGGDPSVINGLVELTGSGANLYLINPAGVIFGADATLNVPASFMTTTADGVAFGDEWFSILDENNYGTLTGDPSALLFSSSEPGSILNAGNLAVGEGQNLSLVGGSVVNTGTLTAPGGSITVAAVPGTSRVNLSHEHLLLALEFTPLTEAGPTPLSATLSLPRLLTGGDVEAITGVTTDAEGRLYLTAGAEPMLAETGAAVVFGDLSVAAETSGNVQVLGDQVSLIGANIDASGSSGGGEVLIGGNYLGEGTTPTATTTFVDSDTTIVADATVQGDGGRVIVWADDATTFAGTITARGGVEGGDGGFVETSGKRTLDFTGGSVDAGATSGAAGLWLLDPADIVIDAAQAIAVQNSLASGTSIELTTVGGSGGNGDITLQSGIDATATGEATLTLTASRYITNGGTGSTIDITDGNLVMNLNQEGLAAEQNPTLTDALATIGTVTNGTTTVNLGAGTYREQSQINISESVIINGAGADATIISGDQTGDGTGDHRVLNISGTATDVTLSNLTVAAGGGVWGGAGIFNNQATLQLDNVTVRDNAATGAGGGIANRNGGTLLINNSLIAENVSTSQGGGIWNIDTGSSLTITDSTISDNQSTSNNGGAIENADSAVLNISGSTIQGNQGSNGGAINNWSGTATITDSTFSQNIGVRGGAVQSYQGQTTISNSTFSENSAWRGGALYSQGGNQLDVSNLTISGNTVTNNGGGMYSGTWGGAPTITVTNSTIFGNSATNGGGFAGEGDITFKNTIIAGNTVTSARPDLYGTVTSNGNNIIGDLTGSKGFNASKALIVPVEQVIDTTLADNGGPTFTHALIAGSPAINTANATDAIETDQRGFDRDGSPDIGAFEFGAEPVVEVVETPTATVEVVTAEAEISITALDGPPEAEPPTSSTANACVPDVILDISKVVDSSAATAESELEDEDELEGEEAADETISAADGSADAAVSCL